MDDKQREFILPKYVSEAHDKTQLPGFQLIIDSLIRTKLIGGLLEKKLKIPFLTFCFAETLSFVVNILAGKTPCDTICRSTSVS